MRNILAIVMSVCMVFSLAGCAVTPSGDKVETTEKNDEDFIVVGCILPLSGTSAYDGESAMNGAKAAANYINDNGGVAGGRKIKLVFEDSATDPNTAANAAEKLINHDCVKVIVGAFNSSCTAAVQPVTESYNIPLVTSIATSGTLTKNNCDFFFRAVGISSLYIGAFASKVINKLDVKKIAYIYQNGDWGLGSVNTFKEYAETLGVETTTVQIINKDDADLYTQLTVIKESKPDVIYAVSDLANAVRVAIQKQELGIDCPIIGEGAWASVDFLEQAGSAAEGIYGMVEYLPDIKTDMNPLFTTLYGSITNGKTPDKYAACEFNAILLVAHAINNATNPDDSTSIRDAIANTDMNILTGPIRFDEDGQGYGFETYLSLNKNGQAICVDSSIIEQP